MSKELRGAVYSRYATISSFANAIGWSYSKANRIVNDEQSPNADEMVRIADALGIATQAEFIRIFFSEQSTKWTA